MQVAAGVFGLKALGGKGGVSFFSQLVVTAGVIAVCLAASAVVYGTLKTVFGIRLDPHEELIGSDLAVHSIQANPEEAL